LGRKSAPDDPAQSQRFLDTAKKVEADRDDALGRAFEKITQIKPREKGDKA
jgi:hypothetical protein